ncbi:MAG: CNNM domain-containing protein [Anaerolineae bacterium]
MRMIDMVIVLLLAVLNGLFSMSEIAIVSARRGRLQQMADVKDGLWQLNWRKTPTASFPACRLALP